MKDASTEKEIVWLGVGANVGNRAVRLRRAAATLDCPPLIKVRRCSPVYETSPVGPRQRWFLNAVLEVETTMSPRELLVFVKGAERRLGRRRRRRWGPREIDIDIVSYGTRRLRSANLTLPHPRWAERKFVLRPLADLRPRLRVPGATGTVAQLLRKLTAPDQSIRLYPREVFRR